MPFFLPRAGCALQRRVGSAPRADAVDQGLFHVWAVSHVDEAVVLFFTDPETLMGESRGRAIPLSPFDSGNADFGRRVVTKISSAVTQRLKWLTEIAIQYRHGSSSS